MEINRLERESSNIARLSNAAIRDVLSLLAAYEGLEETKQVETLRIRLEFEMKLRQGRGEL